MINSRKVKHFKVKLFFTIALLLLCSLRLSHAQSSEDIVAYWNFDEGTGTTVNDKSGHGNHGTIYGANWTDGKIGKALCFDGVDDYVRVPNAKCLGICDKLTIEAWIKRNSVDTLDVIVDNDNGSDSGYRFSVNDKPAFIASNLNGQWGKTSNFKIIDSNWHHVAVTYEKPTVIFYLDGESEKFDVGNQDIGAAKADLFIGRQEWNSGWFDGIIDEVRIYKGVLSELEIKKHAGWIVDIEIDHSSYPEENPTIIITPIAEDLKNLSFKLSIKKGDRLVYFQEVQSIPSIKFEIKPDLIEGGTYNLSISVIDKETGQIKQTYSNPLLAGKLRSVKHLLYVRGGIYSNITENIISRLNESLYSGFTFQPVGAFDTFLPKYDDFIDKVELIKNKAKKGKNIWPWVFFNRIVGCANQSCQKEYFQKIKGIDIYDESGALSDFFEIFKLSPIFNS